MRQADQVLSGIHLHNDLSCCIGNTWALAGSDIAKHKVLSCYTCSTRVLFSVLTGAVLSPSNGGFPLAYVDPRFESPSARSEL